MHIYRVQDPYAAVTISCGLTRVRGARNLSRFIGVVYSGFGIGIETGSK